MTPASAMDQQRAEFWQRLADEAPELGIQPGPGTDRETHVGGRDDVRLKMTVSQDKTSVYLVAKSPAGRAFVLAHLPALGTALRTVVGGASGEADKGRWFRKDNARACVTLKSQWPEALRWLRAQHAAFDRAVRGLSDAG
jgi:hypothetical protein